MLPNVSIAGLPFVNWIDNKGNTYENGTVVTDINSFLYSAICLYINRRGCRGYQWYDYKLQL